MTREEAIEIVKDLTTMERTSDVTWQPKFGQPRHIVDVFVRLGMLKLEEPKSAREKFKQAMRKQGYGECSMVLSDAIDAFDESQK
jgi:hypothetical protein